MLKRLVLPLTVILAMVGCAAKPTPEALRAVADAEKTYTQIANDPGVAQEAPEEKAKAEQYLQEAQALTEKRGKNEEMLYLSDLSVTWSQAAMAKAEQAEVNDDLDMVLSAQEALVKEGAEVTSRGLVLHNWAVHFEVGKSELMLADTEKLAQLAALLQQHPEALLLIEGHADVTGTEEYNKNLSAKRAKVVQDYLVEQGVAPSRLKAVGYGSALPVATNEVPQGREENRRVVPLLGYNVMPPVFEHEEVEVTVVTDEMEE